MTRSTASIKRSWRELRILIRPDLWIHMIRLLGHLYRGHVVGRGEATVGTGARLSPTASFRNGPRIALGARCHIGERSSLWAGDTSSKIVVGQDVLIGPGVFITSSNYGSIRNLPFEAQPKVEKDVYISDGVWLGANVVVLPGVTIGEGCLVGAGSVVTTDLPAWSVCGGVPARVLKERR